MGTDASRWGEPGNQIRETTAADDLCHRFDRVPADSATELLGADDDHERRRGGWGRALAQAGQSVLENRVDSTVRERLRVPVPADRDGVAHGRERASLLV